MATAAQVEAEVERLRARGKSEDQIRSFLTVSGLAVDTEALGTSTSPLATTSGLRDKLNSGAGELLSPPPLAAEEPVAPPGERSGFLSRIVDPIATGGQGFVSSMGSGVESLGAALQQSASEGSVSSFLGPITRPIGKVLESTGAGIRGPAQKNRSKVTPERMKASLVDQLSRPGVGNKLQAVFDAGVQQVPQLIALIGSGGTTGAARGTAFLLEAGSAYEEAISSGASDTEATKAAGITGLANMFLEVKGVGELMKRIPGPVGDKKRFFVELGKAVAAEGSTESLQEHVGLLAGLASYAGDRGMTVNDLQSAFTKEALLESGAAGLIGGITGGGVVVAGNVGAARRGQEDAQNGQWNPPDEAADIPEYAQGYAEAATAPVTIDPQVPIPADVLAEDTGAVSELIAPLEEGVPPAVVGRPELANPNVDPEARAFTDAVLEQQKIDRPEPIKRHDTEVTAEAHKRIAENGAEAETARFMAEGARNDRENAIAHVLLRESSTSALQSMDTGELVVARDLLLKYADDGSEQARALRFRRDWTLEPDVRKRQALQNAVLMPSETLRSDLKAATTDEGQVLAEARYAKEITDARAAIKEVGIDLDTLLDPDNPLTPDAIRQMGQAVRLAHQSRATKPEMMMEYWYNSILSGPTTQAANIVGNTSFILYDRLAKNIIRGAMNEIVRDPNSPRLEDALAGAREIMSPQVWATAWDEAMATFVQERPVFSEQFGDLSSSAQKHTDTAQRGPGQRIPGKTGRVVRTPTRLLMAADEFAQRLIWNSTIREMATREARKAGGSEATIKQVADQLTANPTPRMAQVAFETSLELTFKGKLGEVGSSFLRFRNAVRGGRFVVPFVNVVANITKQSVKKSQLGIIRMASKYAKAGAVQIRRGKDAPFDYTVNEQMGDAAEQIMAWGLAMMMVSWVSDDNEDELPRITGTRRGKTEAAATQFRTAPPQSIRVGWQTATMQDVAEGKAQNPGDRIPIWISYARVEPLAFPITLAADSAEEFRKAINKDEEADWSRLTTSLASLVQDKLFLKSVNDIARMVQSMAREDDSDLVSKFARDFTTSWVPNIVKQTGRGTSKYLKDVNSSSDLEGTEWLVEQGKIAAHEAFPFGDSAPIRHDVWGRPISSGDITGRPATDFLYRLFVPLRANKVQALDVDRLILNYNNTHEKEYFPALPRRRVTLPNREKVLLNREEFQIFLKRSGTMAQEKILRDIENGVLSVEEPTDRDLKRVKKHMTESRQLVVRQMFHRREIGGDRDVNAPIRLSVGGEIGD